MSTTVIASRFGWTLGLAPWLGRSIDQVALAEILGRHQHELLPGATSGTEFIAAQGLPHGKAARLADELRGIGLTVRVVNRTGLTQSARVTNTLFLVAMAGALSFAGFVGSDPGPEGSGFVGFLVPVALSALNTVILMIRGARLPVAGTENEAPEAEVPLLAQTLEDLREDLPDHVVNPILARARALEPEARRHPDGQAAQELEALVDELRSSRDARAAKEARALREEVRRARQAAAESAPEG